MLQQLFRRQSSLLRGTVCFLSTRPPSLTGIQLFVESLARLPCLQCGLQTSLSLSQCADRSDVLVDCGKARLPLACSDECAEKMKGKHSEVMALYDSMMEDVQYVVTSEASKLFSEVIQPSQRTSSRRKNGCWQLTSWTDYLKLYCPTEPWLEDPRALRLLSSAYSYIMTLCTFLPELIDTDKVGNRQETELHVIGARAEAMMPRYLWDELSFFHPGRQFKIKLVGDHVPIISTWKKAPPTKENELIQLEMLNGLYHKIEPRKLGTPDAFVLYNPGVGHPCLRQNWELTLQAVLASCKPVLITSFSMEDQQRDVAALRGLVASSQTLKQHELRFRCRPKQNSFRSLKYQVDPFNVGAPILTNNRAMVVQLASVTEKNRRYGE